MPKKYPVQLSDEERDELNQVSKKSKGIDPKVQRRARILLKSDDNGPGWSDTRIVKAFSCRLRTVEFIRKRLYKNGFAETLYGKNRVPPNR